MIGDVFVIDSDNYTVCRSSPSQETMYLGQFGIIAKVRVRGSSIVLWAAALMGGGHVLVADSSNGRVQVFTATDGNFSYSFSLHDDISHMMLQLTTHSNTGNVSSLQYQ